MRMQHMRYFVEVSRTRNISLAARNLHLSQPSLSFAIRTLEHELGIPLLTRHSKYISLTDAGEKFALHAEQLSDLMHRHSNLFALLKEFREHFPAITYELTFDGSDILMQGLEARIARDIHNQFAPSSGQPACAGLGVGFASSSIAEKICAENCRVIPFSDNEKIYRMIYYVTLKELLDYPLTREFTSFVEAHGKK